MASSLPANDKGIGAAAFMTLLDQMVLSMGARSSEQLLTQAAAIVIATSIRHISFSRISPKILRIAKLGKVADIHEARSGVKHTPSKGG